MTRGRAAAGWGLVTLTALALLYTPPGGRGGDKETPPTLRIGVVDSLFRDVPGPMVQPMLRPVKALIEAQTGMTAQVAPAGDASSLGQQLAADKLHLGVFHGFEFAWARQKHPTLEPLVIAVNKDKNLRSLFVVRADGGACGIADLKGKTLALPKFSREYSHLFLERTCQDKGQGPQHYFGKVTTPADIEEALDDVVDGQAHVTVVDNVALDGFKQRKPGRFAKLKVLAQSEAFPPAVIAYHAGGLAAGQVKSFRDGMIGAAHTPGGQKMLNLCRITAFEPVPDDYEKLLTNIAKAYPPPDGCK